MRLVLQWSPDDSLVLEELLEFVFGITDELSQRAPAHFTQMHLCIHLVTMSQEPTAVCQCVE
jgi:hypothetical protein